MSSEIENELKDHININILMDPYDGLDISTKLFDSGIIDSFGVLELVSFVENNYGLIIRQEHLTLENFSSVSAIIELINMLKE